MGYWFLFLKKCNFNLRGNSPYEENIWGQVSGDLLNKIQLNNDSTSHKYMAVLSEELSVVPLFKI